jgi:hypothetical protein
MSSRQGTVGGADAATAHSTSGCLRQWPAARALEDATSIAGRGQSLPDDPVEPTKAQPERRLALEDGEQRDEQSQHAGRERYQPSAQICNGGKRFR